MIVWAKEDTHKHKKFLHTHIEALLALRRSLQHTRAFADDLIHEAVDSLP